MANRIFLAIICFFALFLLASHFSLFGLKILNVKTGSMSPAIRAGSLIFVRPLASYQVNDVVSFRPGNTEGLVTHRIVGVNPANPDFFQTQGDANPRPDENPVYRRQIIGRVFFALPFLGQVISFIQTKAGFIIFVLLPALFIVGGEIFTIKDEWSRLNKARNKKKRYLKPRVKKLPI